ncbi:MAG: MFS transporter [Cyclobacteriaceae bacterium]
MGILKKVFNISDGEHKPVVFSFLYFFFLMSSYFILRPVRDEMGIQAGVENMQWLFTGTFIVMLLVVPAFGIVTKKVQRKKLISTIYVFFSLNILGFYFAFLLIDSTIIPVIFFIWLSVFNLFVVSIFWSFNSDIFTTNQAKRLYGPIAAGGSSGAIFGPAVTTFFINRIGLENLLLLSAFFLILSVIFVQKLLKFGKSNEVNFERKLNGDIWNGVKLLVKNPLLRQIGIFILLYTTISTFLYFEQAHIVSEVYSSAGDRTFYFGMRDLLVNVATLFIQFFLTGKVTRKWGITFCLILVPGISAFGFLSLGFTQSLYVLLIVQVIYRTLNHSIQRPAREVLFTSVTLEERYRSKNFIDTTLYRGGDAVSGWLFAGLSSVVVSLRTIALLTIPIALVWLMSGFRAGRLFTSKTIKFYGEIEKNRITKKSA